MMVRLRLLKKMLLLCLAGSLLGSYSNPATASTAFPQRPFPQHSTYAPGTIRPNQRTQAQMDDDVGLFYDQWKADYLVAVTGSPTRYRVTVGSEDPSRTVSEGQA
jgi:endoglucanase